MIGAANPRRPPALASYLPYEEEII